MTRPATRSSPAARSVAAGWVAMGAIVYFVAAIVLLHVLRPDVSPVARVTSEYAVGPYGPLMTSAYFVLSLALIGLAVGISRSLGTSIRGTPGLSLLVIAAAGTALAGVVPVDVGAPRPVTTEGWVHRIAAIVAFASMTISPLLLARRFRAHGVWRDVASLGAVLGGTGLVGLALIQLFLLDRGLAGAGQRIVLALVITWMVVIASRLVAGGRESSLEP